MDDDWDLHAVVRACAASVTTNTAAASASASAVDADAAAANNPFPSFPSDLPSHDDRNPFDFSVNEYPFQGLQEIYQQLCVDVPPPPAAAAMMPFPPPQPQSQPQPVQDIMQLKPPHLLNMPIQENVQFHPQNLPVMIPPPVRPVRRRKNQQKMIRQMTQEELSADSWAWRKYGQKPIKGSSYPRNYYRCSTSKGCAARKQVERSPHNPEVFIVSYYGEHTHPRPTHRSSLSGSTRSKLASPPPRGGGGSSSEALSQKGAMAASSSSTAAGSSFSPATPSIEGEGAAAQNVNDDVRMAEEDEGAGDEDDMINPSDLMNDEDEMFQGFQDSDDHSSGGGDFFSRDVLSSPSWPPTGSTSTFNGGS